MRRVLQRGEALAMHPLVVIAVSLVVAWEVHYWIYWRQRRRYRRALRSMVWWTKRQLGIWPRYRDKI